MSDLVRRPRGVRRSLRRDGGEPLALLVNLFDLSIVLVLALAVHIHPHAAVAGADDVRVPAVHSELPRFRRADGKAEGEGTRLGIAYQLADGQVVFVPEDATASGR